MSTTRRWGSVVRGALGVLAALGALGCGGKQAAVVDRCGPVASPRRLHLDGRRLLDEGNAEVRLHGANLQGADAAAAADMKGALGMSFARYRITFGADTRDDSNASGFTAAYQQETCDAVQALAAQGLWVLLELRGDDAITNDPDLYQPGTALHDAWTSAWTYLASAYRDADLIAGYGILAEPSASRGDKEPEDTLTKFQLSLMDEINDRAGDTRTPFFVGPDYNYDTMGYRHDAYFDALAKYHGRLVYEVNCLVPKPWIGDGTGPAGVPAASLSYPQPAPADFSFLITPAPGESLTAPQDDERLYSARSAEPDNFPELLNRDFLSWYLGWGADFAARHEVPMIVDQFGASTAAVGQLAYEQDVIEVAEGLGLGWSRWAYNAGSRDRMITDDPAVHDFYVKIGAR